MNGRVASTLSFFCDFGIEFGYLPAQSGYYFAKSCTLKGYPSTLILRNLLNKHIYKKSFIFSLLRVDSFTLFDQWNIGSDPAAHSSLLQRKHFWRALLYFCYFWKTLRRDRFVFIKEVVTMIVFVLLSFPWTTHHWWRDLGVL